MLNGFYIVKGGQVKKTDKKHAINCSDAKIILEFAVCADHGINKVFVCYSNFGNQKAKEKALKFCNALQQSEINAQTATLNIFSLIAPSAPSIRFCGTLTKDKIQIFEQIAAASAARLTMF